MLKKWLVAVIWGVMIGIIPQSAFAQDYWVYADAYIQVYCDSDTLKKDNDGNYYEVSTKAVDAKDGSWLGRQSWRFLKKNGIWKYWHSGMDETVDLYTSRRDQEAMEAKSIFAWCKKNS